MIIEYDKGSARLVNLKMRHAMMVHGAKLQSILMEIYPDGSPDDIWRLVVNREQINENLKSDNPRLVNWYAIDRKLNYWQDNMNEFMRSGAFEWEKLKSETDKCMKEMIEETNSI
jgi:hypothetical protein